MTLQKRATKKPLYNANLPLPETITPLLIDGINNLPGDDHKTVYLKEVFLDKYVSRDTAPANVRRQRALNKWLATEENNRSTNERILITPGSFEILPKKEYRLFVEKAREIIESILTPVPAFEVLIGSFSGGASTSRKRTASHPAGKYLGKAHITEDARELWEELYPSLESWYQYKDDLALSVVPGNVLFTVPKNADIDRVACKEPDINMFMQKGIGDMIRHRLRRVGINLNDQSRNQRLAREGSITGKLATLDLSSASDSVSYNLVEELLPPMWFGLLDRVRSPLTCIDGEWHRNEMFSSMGNGFTFELESLLFYALARTTAYFTGISGVVSVYGDDIICPSSLAPALTDVLDYFGFEVNTKKSYWSGPFRESCGGHFINGLDVTPFYLRGPITCLTDLIHAANSLRKWSEVKDGLGINDPGVWDLWSSLRDMVPKSLWGGREYSSKLQLVSPHCGRSTLSPRKKEVKATTGNYIHWLNTTDTRDTFNGEPIVTSLVTEEVPRYRKRPVSGTDKLFTDFFVEEI